MFPSKEELYQQLNREEVYRYLSARNKVPEEWQNHIEDVIREAIEVCSIQWTGQVIPIFKSDRTRIVLDNAVVIHSADLADHLKESKKVYIGAATLGFEFERLVKRYMSSQPSKGVILDAAGSVLIETICDWIEVEVIGWETGTFRFSPGYGDLELEYQKHFGDIIDIKRHTGIFLSPYYLMTPQKSVIFIKGDYTSDSELLSCGHKCSKCQLATCNYRQEGEVDAR